MSWPPAMLAALAETEQRVRRRIDKGEDLAEFAPLGPSRSGGGAELRWGVIHEVKDCTLMVCWTDPETGEERGNPFEVHTIGLSVYKPESSTIIPDPLLTYFWPQLARGDNVLLVKIRGKADPDIPAGWWAILPLLPPSFCVAKVLVVDEERHCLVCKHVDEEGETYDHEFDVFARVWDTNGQLTANPVFALCEEFLEVGMNIHVSWTSGVAKGWWMVGDLHEGMGVVRWARVQTNPGSGSTLQAMLLDQNGAEYGGTVTVRVRGVTAGRALTITPNLAICAPLLDAGSVISVGYSRGFREGFWLMDLVYETCEHPAS